LSKITQRHKKRYFIFAENFVSYTLKILLIPELIFKKISNSTKIKHRFLSHWVAHGLRIAFLKLAHAVGIVDGHQRYIVSGPRRRREKYEV
jgi:hypothetical protein